MTRFTHYLLLAVLALPVWLAAQDVITIDGDFSDWHNVPVAVSDPADDAHDTEGTYPDDGQPVYREYSDVDILEVKFTNDAENLYGYIKASGIIGRTSSDTTGHTKKGRYYFIFTIDVDDNDTTGYRLKEGGYYPDSRGYDMNMEVEFYNGGYNTGHYINHEFMSDYEVNNKGLDDLANGIVDLAPGTYDYYTQWVTFPDSSYVMVADRGPVYYGIITIAVSPDGHEAEIKAPMWGFLKTPAGENIIEPGRTIDISASLEASGELSEEAIKLGYTPGSTSVWGSDTAEPFSYLVKETSTGIAENAGKNIAAPARLLLHGNYPNPFNPRTTISWDIPENRPVRLVIYDISGKEIRTLVNEIQGPGNHQVVWNGLNQAGQPVSSGIYIYRLHAGNEVQAAKLILSR